MEFSSSIVPIFRTSGNAMDAIHEQFAIHASALKR